MKKFFMAVVALGMFACNQPTEKTASETESKMDESKAIMNMSGYTPTYSSDVAIGNPKLAENVLALYKIWDSGDLATAKSYFADSVRMYLSNGILVSGTRDEAMAAMQGARDGYSAMKNTVHVVFPVTLKPSNDEWVAIWATEAFTDKAGKTDSVIINETWRFNKDGKADLMYQYGRPAASKPMPAAK